MKNRSFFRVKDKFKLQQTFSVDPVYLRHETSQDATDFMVNLHFFNSTFTNQRVPETDLFFLLLPALADPSEPEVPVAEALVRPALLRTEEAPGSHQTCQILYSLSNPFRTILRMYLVHILY